MNGLDIHGPNGLIASKDAGWAIARARARCLDRANILTRELEERVVALEAQNKRLQHIVDQVDDVLVINFCLRGDNEYTQALHDLVQFNISIHDYFREEEAKGPNPVEILPEGFDA